MDFTRQRGLLTVSKNSSLEQIKNINVYRSGMPNICKIKNYSRRKNNSEFECKFWKGIPGLA